MTFEILTYLVLFFSAVFFNFVRVSDFSYKLITFAVLLIFSITTRYSGFDIDIRVSYAPAMSSESMLFYYVKEPVFWLGSRFIYNIVKSHEIVFVFYDLVSFFIIFKIQEKFRFPRSFLYAYLLFFPTVFGFNNVYRQYLSVCFLLLAMSYSSTEENKRSYFCFILSVLSHNAAILFLPLLFIFKKERGGAGVFKWFLVLFFISLGPYLMSLKQFETGQESYIIYLTTMFIIFFFIVLSSSGMSGGRYGTNITAGFYVNAITIISSFFSSGGAIKRLGMFSLMVLLVLLFDIINARYRQKKMILLILISLMSIVTLTFPSSLKMLMTSKLYL